MKRIKGDLILEKDTVFKEDIVVEGNIKCVNGLWNIKARNIKARNINAWDINVRDINAYNINARDINAGNINAGDINAGNINVGNINAGDIDAEDIICVSRKKTNKDSKTIAYSIITDRYNREKREVMREKVKTDGTKEDILVKPRVFEIDWCVSCDYFSWDCHCPSDLETRKKVNLFEDHKKMIDDLAETIRTMSKREMEMISEHEKVVEELRKNLDSNA